MTLRPRPVTSDDLSWRPETTDVPKRQPFSTDDLCRLVGVAFSDQQLDAITAPLEPGVIVAGAGSGKTTVMAARVAWVVGTGAVSLTRCLV